jgi:hypothetical protein
VVVTEVAAVTGERSPNRTGTRFGVYGTDLGILWDNGNGEILAAFGDSYGVEWGGSGSGPNHADWRWNVLTASTTADLSAGLALYPVVTRPDGTAAQFLEHDTEVRREVTVIPTAGIAADGVNYVHYMSVRRWGRPGHWETNHGGIAVSTDHGRTWSKPRSAHWPNRHDTPFQLGAFAREGDFVYLFGTPNGRFGAAFLARVDKAQVADVGAYEYWTGRDWSDRLRHARPVFPGPVGELSVQYSQFHGVWLAMHLHEQEVALVVRHAPQPTGPWSAPIPVVSGREYRGLYGGYLHPWALNGPEIYFTMSQWGPYNVTLYRADLTPLIRA